MRTIHTIPFVLLMTTMLFIGANAATALPGDANNDDVVDARDVTALVSQILGKATPIENSDTNLDGTVDVADVVTLLARIGDVTVPSDFYKDIEFLFTGGDPIQILPDPTVMKPEQIAVLRGRVLTTAGEPLPLVTIQIQGHPEFGYTRSREDGTFDFAANGGGILTLQYQKNGFLPASRQISAPWRDFACLPDVALVPRDDSPTLVDLTAPASFQEARGDVVSDDSGDRQATLLLPPGLDAEMVLPGGGTQPMESMTLRVTEYTVGAEGPRAMPAELPPTSGYTYAVDISADEVTSAGAQNVVFSEPAYFYVENFLNMPVGIAVPVGYLDKEKAAWIPEKDGRVIRVLSIGGGIAALDTNGDSVADDAPTLAALGITDQERQKLAGLYSAGESLWRVPFSHLTTYDLNYGTVPKAGAVDPIKAIAETLSKLPDFTELDNGYGSVETEGQVLRESVGIPGTPFTLNYSSYRTPGYKGQRILRIPLTESEIPAVLKRVDLEITIAGRKETRSFAPAPDLVHTFEWDGKDAYGRMTRGWQPVTIKMGYVYDGYYALPPALAKSFGAQSGQRIPGDIPARDEVILWTEQKTGLSSWNVADLRLGGWTIDVHHTYDEEGRVLHRGDGGRQSIDADAEGLTIINTVAGIGQQGFSGDGGLATKARIYHPVSVAMGPHGELFFCDEGNNRVRKVDTDGIITTVAGNGYEGFDGDGGFAIQAGLNGPYDVAVRPDGGFYIVEADSHRIRYVDPNGIISTAVGGPLSGYSGDGGPATEAKIWGPLGVALAPDGTLYVSDSNNVVRKVTPDGIISTFAGTGAGGYFGDGGPATGARFNGPWGIRVAPDGSLIIPDTFNNVIRKVGTDGIVTTIAGTGAGAFSGDGGPATLATFKWPRHVAIAPDGSLFIEDGHNNRIRHIGLDGIIRTVAGLGTYGSTGDEGPSARGEVWDPQGVAVNPDGILYIGDPGGFRIRSIAPPMPGYDIGDAFIPSADGMALYRFGVDGRHLKTYDTMTGAADCEFTYNTIGLLIKITDRDGVVAQIERNEAGDPTAIVASQGMRTAINLEEHGYLSRLDTPDGKSTSFEYTSAGLLTAMVAPGNRRYTFTYDQNGRANRIDDPAGGFTEWSKTFLAEGGYEVTCQTAGGRVSRQRVESPATGGRLRKSIYPDGTRTELLSGADGRRTVKQPGGIQAVLTESPDPRFGMQAPYPSSRVITTSGGLTATMSLQRNVTLAQEGDPLSLAEFTDAVTINGRAYQSTYSQNDRTITDFTPTGRRTATILDAQGRVIRRELPGLVPTYFSYNARGNLAEIRRGDGPAARATRFAYTAQDRIASVTDAVGRVSSYVYDGAGDRTQAVLPGGRVISYAYDAEGNLASLTPPSKPAHSFTWTPVYMKAAYSPPSLGDGAQPTRYSYSQDRRLTRVTRPDGTTVDFLMDEGKRRVAVVTPDHRIDYSYNALNGNLKSVETSDGVLLTLAFDGTLPTTSTWTSPVSGAVERIYDNDFRLASLRVNKQETASWQYDNDSLVISAGDLSMVRAPQSGLITSATLGVLTESNIYNEFGETTRYTVLKSGVPFYSVDYSLDALGRITAQMETISGVGHSGVYSYYSSGALKTARVDDVTTSFTYDANGNRARLKKGASSPLDAVFNARDQVTQYGAATYDYSLSGDLESKTKNAQTTSYEYDALGNLRSVTLPDGKKIEYVIDGTNRRIGKKVNGTLTRGWLYMDGVRLAAELDGANQVVSAFIYASCAHVPDTMVRGGVTYRIVTDPRGSPRFVVNSQTGEIAQRLDYDAFGNVLADTNPGFQPFGFAGGLYDPETGLVRFGVRDYDPETGRWTTPDPFGLDGDPTNLYRYALNDPINSIDPSGVMESKIDKIRETLWALGHEEQRIGGWSNMKAAYGEVDCTEHALFGDPIMRFYPSPWPWDPKPYERIMASGGRFLPKRDHNIRMEKLKLLGLDDGELDLRWFVHGYLSSVPLYAAKYGTGIAYNLATGRGFKSKGGTTNMKSLELGQIVRQSGMDLNDFAQLLSGGPPANTSYQQGDQFPPE